MTAKTPRNRALTYLRMERVRVVETHTHGDSIRPYGVEAIVHGHKSDYLVRLVDGIWSATCRCEDVAQCPHLLAVRMVTGHGPNAAAVSN